MLDCMYNKAKRKLYMVKRIRPLITNSVAALVYKTHVLPMLDYGDFLVDSGKLSKIARLNNLHRRAVKLIDNKAHRDQDIAQLTSIYFFFTFLLLVQSKTFRNIPGLPRLLILNSSITAVEPISKLKYT